MAAKVKEENTTAQIETNDDINSDKTVKAKEKTAQKEKKPKKEKKKKKGGGGIKIVPILILLAVIGFLVGVFGFNLLDIRDKYIYSALRNVPIVKNLIPLEDSATPAGIYDSMTREDLISQITSLNTKLEQSQKQITDLNALITDNNTELTRLREIEDQYSQYKADKAEFDRMIAEGDTSAYAKFFESISPENAAELYKEAVAANQVSKEISQFVRTFSDIDETDAAAIMEQWIPSDMNLVVSILRNMNTERRGAILAAMDPSNAAAAGKMLSPF